MLVEKPVGMNVEEIKEMDQVAKETGKYVFRHIITFIIQKLFGTETIWMRVYSAKYAARG